MPLAVYDARKEFFVLTKCDLAETEVIEQNEKRLKQYMPVVSVW